MAEADKSEMEMTEKPAEGVLMASSPAAAAPAALGESVDVQEPYPVGKFTGFLCRRPLLAMVAIFLFTIVIVGIGAVAGGGGFGWVGTGGYLLLTCGPLYAVGWKPFEKVSSSASVPTCKHMNSCIPRLLPFHERITQTQ